MLGLVRRLYNLFVGVNIPDQNFKGEALEHLVRFSKSVLPPKGCKIENGEKKQVDAAFKVGNRLVIVECKAIGISIGFSRGDSHAIQYRKEQLDNALKQVDEKAQWLATNPIGTNYDISKYVDILPVVVTPFAEYIPSLQSKYWVTDDVPRVITPNELKSALDRKLFANVSRNIFIIQNTA